MSTATDARRGGLYGRGGGVSYSKNPLYDGKLAIDPVYDHAFGPCAACGKQVVSSPYWVGTYVVVRDKKPTPVFKPGHCKPLCDAQCSADFSSKSDGSECSGRLSRPRSLQASPT